MRVKRGVVSHRKHKKLLDSVKGYRMTRRRLVKVAIEASQHAGQYAFAGRRKKKSAFRTLWITRISHALATRDISYSRFIARMKKANITLDRKMLAWLLRFDPEAFDTVVDRVKKIA